MTVYCVFASSTRQHPTTGPVGCQSPVLGTARNGIIYLTNADSLEYGFCIMFGQSKKSTQPRKGTSYFLVFARNSVSPDSEPPLDHLAERVNEHIKGGYQPIGGPVMVPGGICQ